jgi:hypothetical protein
MTPFSQILTFFVHFFSMKFSAFIGQKLLNLEFLADPTSSQGRPVGVCIRGPWKGRILVCFDDEIFETCNSQISGTLCVFAANPFNASPGSTLKLTHIPGISMDKDVFAYVINDQHEASTLKIKHG